MSLVATDNPTADDTDDTVANNGFWPPIAVVDFRDTQRLGHDITPPRLALALQIAIADINRQLRHYQAKQEAAGIPKHGDVPPEPWQTAGQIATLYRQAVYASAHATIWERYRDYSATGADRGEQRDEDRRTTADALRRDARWAVAEITGRPHTTVELI